MTALIPEGKDTAALAVLEAAEAHYERTIEALNDLIGDVKAGRSGRAKELKSALGDLGKALQTAFDERSKVAKRIQSEGGAVNGYAIDLDAARVEIERRLACLRGAGGAAGVPGVTE